jgi:hypothetical protein
MEFSANTKPSEGLSCRADDSGVLGIKHGAMVVTRKEIKRQKRLRERLRGTELAMKPATESSSLDVLASAHR